MSKDLKWHPFWRKVEEYKAKHDSTVAEAIRATAKAFPVYHQGYLEEANRGG